MARAGKNDNAAARRDKLAQELRENLKRRKARQRSADTKKVGDSTGPDEPEERDR